MKTILLKLKTVKLAQAFCWGGILFIAAGLAGIDWRLSACGTGSLLFLIGTGKL